MKALRWLYHGLLATAAHFFAHAAAPLAIFAIWTGGKVLKDHLSLEEILAHPLELVSAAAVTLLSSLCIAFWRVMHHRGILLEQLSLKRASPHDSPKLRRSNWEAICQDIRSASSHDEKPLSLLGATGKDTFSSASSPLLDVLRTYQGKIRILLLRPGSEASHARSSSLDVTQETYRDDILDSIDFCKDLLVRKQRAVEVRLYDSIPVWKLVVVNGSLWVQHYQKACHVENTAMYCFDGGGSTLSEGLRCEFEERWSHPNSKRVDLRAFHRSEWEKHC